LCTSTISAASTIFAQLNPRSSDDDNRRVPAVLAYIGR